jgi:putative membrane protein
MPAVSPEDHQAIEAAFDAAQARTSAPLMGVAAEASSDYAAAPLSTALILALLAPWPLLLLTRISAERIFAAQLAVALAALGLFSFASLRVKLTSRRARRAIAHRAALVQYAMRGGEHAPGRNAVLIYVSLAERYARIIAGDEASRHITAQQWQGLVDDLTSEMAKGDVKAALSAAAGRAADMLAPHFPPSGESAPKAARFHSA